MQDTTNCNTTTQIQSPVGRNSGIELLKIFGIFLIVISHIVRTLNSDFNQNLGYNDYYMNLDVVTTNPQTLVLILFRYSGLIGNALFFICSAWFLIDKKQKKAKIWRMICDVFTISILWLLFFLIVKGGVQHVGLKNTIKSFFPTFLYTYWYITTYIIFYFIYPFLNIIIEKINQRQHLAIASVLFICYLCIATLYRFPCYSHLLLWISVYFVISYFKKYGQCFCNSTTANIILLLLGIAVNTLLVVLINLIGLETSFFASKLSWFNKNCNVFLFMSAFGAFNLFSKLKFTNRFINYIASLSLLIYVIHENFLFCIYGRPQIWQWIYLYLGYDCILLWVFLYALALFIASIIVATIYKFTLQKIVKKIADWSYSILAKFFNWTQEILLRAIK